MSTAAVRYTITANIEHAEDVEAYVDWLENGHVQASKANGALSVEGSRLDPCDTSGITRIESSYVFPSRDSLQRYLEGPALVLRKEGMERFGHIRRDRRVGSIDFAIY